MKQDLNLCHLLVRGEFRVWCRPKSSPANLRITTRPSKVTCATCLTAWRKTVKKRGGFFAVAHVAYERHQNKDQTYS